VPSYELVEISRYYRFEKDAARISAQLFGSWWRFVAMCLFVYGLLPRIVLWLLCSMHLSTISARTIILLPGVKDVLERMNSKKVSTSDFSSADLGESGQTGSGSEQIPKLHISRDCSVVSWSNAVSKLPAVKEKLADHFNVDIFAHSAGGNKELEDDQHVVEACIRNAGNSEILVLVKSWEPPTGEFLDFLNRLRLRTDKGRPINILPLGYCAQPNLCRPEEPDLLVWKNAVHRLADPWTSVVVLPEAL
jgi:hypothetical protein